MSKAAYNVYAAGGAATPTYIEDVFSTYLYTGNSSTQTITNGIDLSGKGGLVWAKLRNAVNNHALIDTVRPIDRVLDTSSTSGQSFNASALTSFNNNGFTVGGNNATNGSGYTYASWTFRKQPKFFDVVTWTGDDSSTRQINHNLGATPAFIIIKRTDTTSDWIVAARKNNNTYSNLRLNNTNAELGSFGAYPTGSAFTSSTQLGVGWWSGAGQATLAETNATGGTYVAYLFAHDAGGFGLTGNDNVISCGSFTTDSNARASVTLGWEPQWVLFKASQYGGRGVISDSLRGANAPNANIGNSSMKGQVLVAEDSYAESALGGSSSHGFLPNATGFTIDGNTYQSASDQTFIYVAIRKGPMKVPTVASSVFSLAKVDASTVGGGISMLNGDMALYLRDRFSGKNSGQFFDRIRGFPQAGASAPAQRLNINSGQEENISSYVTTSGFNSSYSNCPFQASNNIMRAGFSGNSSEAGSETSGASVYGFCRAPGFFDIVCYKGTYPTATQNVSHNLGVIPELIMCKQRDSSGSFYVSTFNNGTLDKSVLLNFAIASPSSSIATTSATSTYFVANNADGGIGNPNGIMVAYLFATLSGISKVGSYTGNGSTQTINCGFSAGARFVLIKRTDSTGNWYVFDTARGIISGNDPLFYLNIVNAEDSTYDVVDPENSGFIINNNDPYHTLNAASANYIFLAIA
jgi:hypothetical protein